MGLVSIACRIISVSIDLFSSCANCRIKKLLIVFVGVVVLSVCLLFLFLSFVTFEFSDCDGPVALQLMGFEKLPIDYDSMFFETFLPCDHFFGLAFCFEQSVNP